jgi:hypothetical protein
MSIATIRNDDLSRRQHATHIARNLSVVESIGRPQAKFGVQCVRSDFYQTDEDVALHDHDDDRLLNARQVADRCSTTESRFCLIRRTGTSRQLRSVSANRLLVPLLPRGDASAHWISKRTMISDI